MDAVIGRDSRHSGTTIASCRARSRKKSWRSSLQRFIAQSAVRLAPRRSTFARLLTAHLGAALPPLWQKASTGSSVDAA